MILSFDKKASHYFEFLGKLVKRLEVVKLLEVELGEAVRAQVLRDKKGQVDQAASQV